MCSFGQAEALAMFHDAGIPAPAHDLGDAEVVEMELTILLLDTYGHVPASDVRRSV